ncbi:MAG: hypothetical protein H7Z41_02715 [Cytophagales bacterium]|nr:hypothetical protein [Armatimonadota bacterium]
MEQQHPLQGDVVRLRNAERRLRGLAPGTAAAAGLVDPYQLPPVATQLSAATAAKVVAALQERRRIERRLLAKRTAAQLGAFLGGINFRQERLLEQRRAELQAVGRAEQERLARSIRDTAAGDTRDQVAKRTSEILNQQLPVGVLSQQLRPETDLIEGLSAEGVRVPGAVADEERLRTDIAKLEADSKAPYVLDRARFIVKLRAARTKLRDLQAEIDRLVAAGDASADDRITAARNARLAEIELELEALRDDAETLFLFRGQRTALTNALAAEAEVAARAAQFQGLSGKSDDGAGAVRFASLFGSTPGIGGSTSRALDLRQALQRVSAQRQRLQRFISVDVRDSVRDAAETHQVDVVFAPVTGRRDMTFEFGQWIRGGAGRYDEAAQERGVSGG